MIVKLGNTKPSNFWLWPNRAISKAESGQLREAHNRLAQQHQDLLDMLGKLAEATGNFIDDEINENVLDQAVLEAKRLLAQVKG